MSRNMRPPRRPSAAPASLAWACAMLVLAACTSAPQAPQVPQAPSVSDRIVLLPQTGGGPSALEVSTATGQKLRLDQPYASAELQGGNLLAVASDATAVQARWGSLLAQQPARPRSFILPFEANATRLGPAAAPVLAEVRAALALLPAAEMIVTGHTDSVGSSDSNDRVSLARAEAVRELLVAAGVDRAMIAVVGRGKRELLVPTADGVAEARNRRVEIKIR